MAKESYKIPVGLDATYGDMEIAIQSADGIGVKPLPIKVILTYLGGFILLLYIETKTLVQYGSILQKIIFAIVWLALVYVLSKFDKTKQMQIQWVPTLLEYLPKSNRHVFTRTGMKANDFYRICGISKIDKKTGMIHHTDGTFGYMYLVVGSASILLFDENKNLIINRVDDFYKKIKPGTDYVFITSKEAQKVHNQIAHTKLLFDQLEVADEELMGLLNERFFTLRDFVGKEFKSIHQYLEIKSDTKDGLNEAKNILQSEVEGSSLMFKKCLPLYESDILDVLKLIYRNEDR